MAAVFAYIFLDFLIIPVGQVFGSQSAPSYFSLMSDICTEVVASTVDLTTDGTPLLPHTDNGDMWYGFLMGYRATLYPISPIPYSL